MEHTENISKLAAFLDNELTDEAKNTVKAHLSACPECSKEFDVLVSEQLYIRKTPVIEVDASFRAKIAEKIEAQRTAKPFGFGRCIPIPLALSALILIVSAYMIVAPVAYGMGNDSLKSQAKQMVLTSVLACSCGSVFAPAAFVKMCDVCVSNACTCCKAKCGANCNMKMKNGGCEDGKQK
jgi:anti-sigma factor RsiW